MDLRMEELECMENEMNGWVVAGIAIGGGALAGVGGYFLAVAILT